MNYKFSEDIKSIREILGISQSELAKQIGVEQVTLSRSENEDTMPSAKLLENVYSFAFKRDIKINKIKEMLWKEDLKDHEKLLFHGAKDKIVGEIDIHKGRENNDFGQGFYTGESYDQSVSFISSFDHPSVYFAIFDDSDLKCRKYSVDQDWMMTISYYRGALDEYKNHQIVQELIKKSRDCDYIIAPIADNRMFQIINSFISGELTDEQCKHCLAATNLGMQYVFISEKAISKVKLVERVYVSEREKAYYKNIRLKDAKTGDDKVKVAKRLYRGQGKYIDEILV